MEFPVYVLQVMCQKWKRKISSIKPFQYLLLLNLFFNCYKIKNLIFEVVYMIQMYVSAINLLYDI